MDHEAAVELLKERLGPALAERLAEQLLRRTDSDPTLLAQVLDQVDPASDGLHRVALHWPSQEVASVTALLGSLDPAAREVVEVGAVIGREFDLAILERACAGIDVLGGLEAVGEVLRQLPGHVFSFRRALFREVCYDQLGPRRRAELHEKVAAALSALGATSGARAATVVELAFHLGEAAALGGGHRLDAAAAAAATAGATAASEGVQDIAAEYFGQAATFAGRAGWAPGQAGRLMVAAGTARLRAARSHADTLLGRASLTGAVRMGIRAEDPGLVAAAALGFGPRPTLGPFGGQVPFGQDQERLDALEFALAEPDELDLSVSARLHARLGVESGQVELALRGNALAHGSGDPRALAEAGLAVAELTGDAASLINAEREAAALGDDELLARVYDLQGNAGLERLAALRLPLASAFTRWYVLRAAAWLAVLGGDTNAQELCDSAVAAGRIINPVAADLVDRDIRAGQARPDQAGVEVEGLTAREQEVLELALSGKPSREIAAALVVGERTVETHLASIYRKLGVRTRVELIMKLRLTDK